MNEWGGHNISSNSYASAYNSAINIVREVYRDRIIIDIPGFGQEPQTAVKAVDGTNGVKLNDTNIILSAHIYDTSYNGPFHRYTTVEGMRHWAAENLL